ncbi:hypothetical protein PIB30_074985 [Stylosanthes scabra]|uniref:Uncharacterized protein n=1 Tax=Stylosanthes scabra TaxID=79078 RepID=A0ABU6XNR9_9FABA|nr:hypothetical protein [Stylosanthes scabra]
MADQRQTPSAEEIFALVTTLQAELQQLRDSQNSNGGPHGNDNGGVRKTTYVSDSISGRLGEPNEECTPFSDEIMAFRIRGVKRAEDRRPAHLTRQKRRAGLNYTLHGFTPSRSLTAPHSLVAAAQAAAGAVAFPVGGDSSCHSPSLRQSPLPIPLLVPRRNSEPVITLAPASAAGDVTVPVDIFYISTVSQLYWQKWSLKPQSKMLPILVLNLSLSEI